MDKKYHKKPFTLIEPKYFKYPIIISSPHSGRYYPDSFIDKINVDIYDLRKLEDIYVDKIVSFISKELFELTKFFYFIFPIFLPILSISV